MDSFNSAKELIFYLKATSSSEAKRLWRQSIKEKWNNECAYCGSKENLTIDHVIPQSKGGNDFITNVVCCCQKCNLEKSHNNWEIWYSQQDFFTEEKRSAIIKWINGIEKQPLYRYKQRRNNAS